MESKDWHKFYISDIFDVRGTITTHPSKLKVGSKTPRITCAATNNALDDVYDNDFTEVGEVITIDSATIGYVSYQPYNFIATDHVEKLIFKPDPFFKLNLGLYFVSLIRHATNSKYGYGYKFSQTRIKKQKILLPTTPDGSPDYEYMENYSKALFKKKEQEYVTYIEKRLDALKNVTQPIPLQEKEWKEFILNDIFKIKSSSSGIDKNKLINSIGNIPYITRTDLNNGYGNFIGKQNFKYSLDYGNVITIGLDTQTVFYQSHSFYTGQNIQLLKFEGINKFNAHFIIALLKIQLLKFNWGGNGATLTRLKRSKIMLPINSAGTPDYDYMEQYMKYQEYQKLQSYLDFKQKNK